MKNERLNFFLSKEEKLRIEENANKFGFASVSEYLRYVGKNTKEIIVITNQTKKETKND